MADHIFQKKGESTWYVRLDVPKDVRHAFGGRRVLVQSLKTGLRSEAMERRLPWLAKWKSEIRDARERKSELGDAWREELHVQSVEQQKNKERRILNLFSKAQTSATGPVDLSWIEGLREVVEGFIEAGRPDLAEKVVVTFQHYLDELPNLNPGSGAQLIEKMVTFFGEIEASVTADEYELSKEETEEAMRIMADHTEYKPRSPITQKRIEAFRLSQERKGIEPKTIDQMSRRVDQFSKYLSTTGKPVTFDTVSAYLDQLTDKAGNALSSKTKKQHAWSCSSFWKWACKHDVDWREQYKGQPNPFADHDYPTIKGEAISWEAFSKKDVERLHALAVEKKDQPLADLIAIGAYSGARLEEIGRIHRDTITIKDGVPVSFSITEAKSAAGIREVPFHPKIAGLISSLLEASKDGFLLPGGNNKYGNRLDALSKRFGRLKTQAGFDKQHVFHSIRKTTITLVHQAGADVAVMPGLFGHETGLITFDLYSKGPSLEQKAKVIALLDFKFDCFP